MFHLGVRVCLGHIVYDMYVSSNHITAGLASLDPSQGGGDSRPPLALSPRLGPGASFEGFAVLGLWGRLPSGWPEVVVVQTAA